MNKFLFISVCFFCFLVSACATKPAQQVTTTLPVEQKNAAVPEGTYDQPKSSAENPESSILTDHSSTAKSTKKQNDLPGVAFEPVYFDYDSFLLSEKARSSLTVTAKDLLKNSALKAIVAGHCDDRGSEMYNIALGEKRATSVKNYLVTLGVEPDRLEVVSYGEEKPAVNGFDEESRALNRRVEFMSAE